MALAPTAKDRNKRLEDLAKAAKVWFDLEKNRLDKETQFLRQVLTARGVNDAAAKNLLEGAEALEDEINAYLFIAQQK